MHLLCCLPVSQRIAMANVSSKAAVALAHTATEIAVSNGAEAMQVQQYNCSKPGPIGMLFIKKTARERGDVF